MERFRSAWRWIRENAHKIRNSGYWVEGAILLTYVIIAIVVGVLTPIAFSRAMLVLVFITAWTLYFGFRSVDQRYQSLVTFAGLHIGTWDAGPHFLIPGVMATADVYEFTDDVDEVDQQRYQGQVFLGTQRIDADMQHSQGVEDEVVNATSNRYRVKLALAEFKRDSARVVWHLFFRVFNTSDFIFELQGNRMSIVTQVAQYVRSILAQLRINDGLECSDGIGRLVVAHLLKSSFPTERELEHRNLSEEKLLALRNQFKRIQDFLRLTEEAREAAEQSDSLTATREFLKKVYDIKDTDELNPLILPPECFTLGDWGIELIQGGVVLSDVVLNEKTVEARRSVNIAEHRAEAEEHIGSGEGRRIGAFKKESGMSAEDVSRVSVAREVVGALPTKTPIIIGGKDGLDLGTLAATAGVSFTSAAEATKGGKSKGVEPKDDAPDTEEGEES